MEDVTHTSHPFMANVGTMIFISSNYFGAKTKFHIIQKVEDGAAARAGFESWTRGLF